MVLVLFIFALLNLSHLNKEVHGDVWVTASNSQSFNLHNEVSRATNLIIVAGHSVTVSGHLHDAGIDEKDWYLLDYQKGHGLPQAIIAHIRRGIVEASKDAHSLLLFSGGETRADAGPENEGSSYFRVADAMNLWEGDSRSRTTTEEFATDSFQNLLFSICRFKEVTGSYPQKITVVSFSFKKNRFEKLHAVAMRWPSDQFLFIGVDPDSSTGFDLESSLKGEQENSALPFKSDPYGCHTSLRKKRKDRNPFSRTPPYHQTCPELKELMNFCGPALIPTSRVPW